MSSLYPYQIKGSEFLAERRFALLADEMGLGKTIQAIHGLCRIRASQVIIVCPQIARVNWSREIGVWAKERFSTQILSKTDTLEPPSPSAPHRAYVCTFEWAVKNQSKILTHCLSYGHFDAMIVDEAHYLKNSKSNRARAIVGKDGLRAVSSRVWLLSGTPMPNHIGESWVYMRLAGQTNLSETEFTEKYCLTRKVWTGQRGFSTPRLQVLGIKSEMLGDFQRRLFSFTLKRTKKDAMLELPPIRYKYIDIQGAPVDFTKYRSFVKYIVPRKRLDELAAEIKFAEDTIEEFAARSKTKDHSIAVGESLQFLQGFAHSVNIMRMAYALMKVPEAADRIAKFLDENPEEKAVVFGYHKDAIAELVKRLGRFYPVLVYGATDPRVKQVAVDAFQKDARTRLFVGNILSCGVAVTLTTACTVFFLEQDWVPGNNAQAVMRVHRIGQTRKVTVYTFRMSHGPDDYIARTITNKTKQLTEAYTVDFEALRAEAEASGRVEKSNAVAARKQAERDDRLKKAYTMQRYTWGVFDFEKPNGTEFEEIHNPQHDGLGRWDRPDMKGKRPGSKKS